jgi:VanZ family protein
VSVGERFGAWFDRLVGLWLAVHRVVRWLAVAAAVATLWWSSSRSPRPSEPSLFGALVHNAMHVVAYAVLGGAVWCAAHAPARGVHQRAAAAVAVLFAVAYGVVDELHQARVHGRVASVWDVLSDACGGLLAVWLLQRHAMAPRARALRGACLLVAIVGSVSLATLL